MHKAFTASTVIVVVALFALLHCPLLAQNAELSGLITDPSGLRCPTRQ